MGAMAVTRTLPISASQVRRDPPPWLLRQDTGGLVAEASHSDAVLGKGAPEKPEGGPRGLDDLAGLNDLKALLRARFVYPLRDPDRARRYRQRVSGGVLLYGLPGTGKTYLTKALAAELDVPVFSLDPSTVLSKWLGDSEKHLAEIFRQARAHPVSLIFVDEVDGLAPSRDGAGEGSQAMQRLLAQLLAELDGFEEKSGQLLFLGATNRPWDVDAALLRPGRFDALAYVDLPNHAARAELLRRRLEGISLAKDVNLTGIAKALEDYSAAETVAVADQAARLAFLDAVEKRRDRPICEEDLRQAAISVHRVATPDMVARFRRFAENHGLPPPGSFHQAAGEPDEIKVTEMAPLLQVSARDLKAEIEVLPFVCYALQHAGIHPVRRIRVCNQGSEESQNLVVEAALVPEDFGSPWTANIAELPAKGCWQNDNISLPLRLDRLQAVQEKEQAHIRVTIRDKDEILFATTRELPVLAYNEWVYVPEFMELTAAFVQSNSPALHPVIEAAAEHLEKQTGQRSFSGYQSNDPKYVLAMLQAIHEVLGSDLRLGYINPPPSFENTGQKVRLVADTLEQGRGTCFDLAILQSALWELIGLHSCIVMVPGHALLACWMRPSKAKAAVTDLAAGNAEARTLRDALADGSLQLFNSVEITVGRTLADAQTQGRAIVEEVLKAGKSVHIIDIETSRARVTPLP